MDRQKKQVSRAVDSIQQRLTEFAGSLKYEDLAPDVVHAVKVRVIDTLGALIGGFFGEPCVIVRNLAARMPNPNGATVIGTRIKTTPDMAAYVNATMARYPELIDAYHWPGSYQGHPSEMVTAILSAGEYVRATPQQYITSIVAGYEVFCRICDVFHNKAIDNANLSSLGTAVAAGRLLAPSPEQLAHCISMAVVPNVMLKQVRSSNISMYKAVASGQACRAGVFAALLARAGMEGPHLPFEGKAGWLDHVARERFTLGTLGANGEPFKIVHTQIKNRPCSGVSIASVLAAEKVAAHCRDYKSIRQATIEVHRTAKERAGSDMHRPLLNPDSRETADHSIPYVTAATLMDGTLTLRSFNDAHLWNPELRALLKKIEVVENEKFTQAYRRLPQEHHARVTVVTNSGQRYVGESGGDSDDMAAQRSDADIEKKFRGLSEDYLGAKRASAILGRLWDLEKLQSVAEIPALFALD